MIVVGRNESDTSLVIIVGRNKRDTRDRSGKNSEILVIEVGGNEGDTSLGVVGRNKRDTRNRSGTNVHDAGLIVLGWSYRNECTNNEDMNEQRTELLDEWCL